jgi:ParB-like chromosome segregation protein Spo0J
MQIRDRIRELRRVRAGSLRPNPRNWRTHPAAQRDALCGVLAEIGYADALLARELPDGSLELIDGHLRAETTPEVEVPVLVVDLDDREAAMLLAVLDPLASLAETNRDALAELVECVETESEAVRKMLDEMAGAGGAAELPEPSRPEVDIPEAFQVVVECRDEAEQRAVFERLQAEGLECKLLTL